jgi:hypothetical protein
MTPLLTLLEALPGRLKTGLRCPLFVVETANLEYRFAPKPARENPGFSYLGVPS